MNEVWASALATIVVAVLTGLSGVLVAYLKSKLSAEERTKLVETARAVIRAVEIIAVSQEWDSADKKAEAMRRMAALTGLSEEQIDTYIEAAVAELKAAGEELTSDGESVVPKGGLLF